MSMFQGNRVPEVSAVDAESGQLCGHFGTLQRRERLTGQFVDDVPRCMHRQEDTDPDRIFGVGKAGFLRRRYVRQAGTRTPDAAEPSS